MGTIQNMTSPLAELGPDTLVLLIPIVAIVGGIGSGIIKTLVRHQRAMAELYHQGAAGSSNREIERLSQEMAELKSLVHQQTIALDNFTSRTISLSAPPQAPTDPLQQRVGS